MVYSEYNKTILPSGTTIVSEKIPSVRSVSIGIWIQFGSRDELENFQGMAHFLEHMLFKGTEKRSAAELAKSVESVGGYLNAYTTKEQTCYYIEILDDQLPLAVDILSDMICNSVMPEDEVEREREVILDEIDSIEDTPEDLVQEVFTERLFPGHPLGQPILGTANSIRNINRDSLFEGFHNYYTASNIIIAAAGNLEHAHLVELVEKCFTLPTGQRNSSEKKPEHIGSGTLTSYRPITQAHLCLGTRAIPYAHRLKYETLLLNTLLGVGMGSRLFQNIREKHGLAYSIYSFVDFFKDDGLFSIYIATDHRKIQKAGDLIEKEISNLLTDGIYPDELQQVKSQVKGNILLGLESTARRMSRLGKMESFLGQFHDIDQIIDDIDKVTMDSIRELINRLFADQSMLKIFHLPESQD